MAGSKYFSGGTKSVTIKADSLLGAEAAFETKATPALTTDAEKTVTDLIATCAKSTSGNLPESCPFYGAIDETGVTYKVTTEPKLAVDVDDDGDIKVTSDAGDGSVSVSYVDTSFGDPYPEQYDEDFSVYVDLAVKGGKLVLVND